MKKIILPLFALLVWSESHAQGFTSPPLQWNIPIVTDDSDYRTSADYHQLIDMNGDGKIDLVDTENEATESTYDVFMNGSQKYWKVYLGNGTSFSPTAIQWNIPASSDWYEFRMSYEYHNVIDVNGDNKPDFVDTENQATESTYDVFLNGSQKYWKVYLNTGSGFSATATQWNIPASSDWYEFRMSYEYHNVIDMNGDNKPDFVDTENEATESSFDVFLNGSQKYWKVYLNTGSGFSPTPIQWNIPASSDWYEFRMSYEYHNVIDMNGDLKPDFVDTENQATESTFDVFLNGSQKYWKVFLNNGSGFSATATQWNIPMMSDFSEFRLASEYHTVIDMDGDRKPEFVDTENHATESTYDVFVTGGQKHWKVYANNGSGFQAAATQWNIPMVSDASDYRLTYDYHTVVDMNGDLKPEFIDSENEAIESSYQVFLNGSQKYWKVYLNNSPALGTDVMTQRGFAIYPNPASDTFSIRHEGDIASISIFNLTGARVKMVTENSGIVDISDLRNGMYIVEVTDSEGLVSTQKLIKQ